MIQFQIITPWQVFDDEQVRYIQPLLAGIYNLAGWQDVTGQEGEHLLLPPCMVVLQVWAQSEIYAQIENDPAFFILWSKEV